MVIKISKGTSTRSTTPVEFLTANTGTIDLKIGDGVMSSVAKRVNGLLHLKFGSSGPWLRIRKSVFLYTNEHVVRPGIEHLKRIMMTYPGRLTIGEVVLTSGGDGQNKDDATMECHNLEVHEDVRRGSSFIADWAIVKFEQAPTKPVEMPAAKGGGGTGLRSHYSLPCP